ncbi:MAG: hypothetical protein ACYDEQ_15320 [Desulfocucumaceae bacterium]
MLLSKIDSATNLTISQKGFIEYLSKTLVSCCPPKLDTTKLSAIYNVKKKYVKIELPHRFKKEYDLSIVSFDQSIVIWYSDTHEHFDNSEYSNPDDWYENTCGFIYQLFNGKIEVDLTYLNNKPWHAKKYYIDENNRRQFFSVENNFLFALIYLFSKRTKIVRRIDFYKD